MTWQQNLDYHTRMYSRVRPDIHPVTENYHMLCMCRADQHLHGLKGYKHDYRKCSSKALFNRAIKIFENKSK